MRKVTNLLLLAVMALSLSGCWNFYGGGWFRSEIDPEQRVNVGLEGTCTDDPITGNGWVNLELTFHDRGYPAADVYGQNKSNKKHMAIHARNPEPIDLGVPCEEADDVDEITEDGAITGQLFLYCPQGVSEGDACGTGFVAVLDTTDGGPDKGDALFLGFDSGYYAGYSFEGTLEGGNFTVETVID